MTEPRLLCSGIRLAAHLCHTIQQGARASIKPKMGGDILEPVKPPLGFPKGRLTTLRISLQAEACLFCLECLDPSSGRNIPAIWHGAGAYPGVFIPET